jgi:1-acyl-sn-glycerol-3-phosphate acyltransferase
MLTCDESLKKLLGVYRILFSDGLEVSGNLSLPQGPKIIAANHTNASDPLYLPFVMDEKPHCLFQNGLFAIPVLGWLLKQTGQVCVDRQHGHPAFEQACALLRQGKTVALFPEGKLCRRENPVKAKGGAVRMALETGAPLVPLGFYVRPQDLINVRVPWNPEIPPGDWQISGKCYARFGEPWHPNPAFSIESQTDELMSRVYTLVDQLAEENSVCVSPISLKPIHQW